MAGAFFLGILAIIIAKKTHDLSSAPGKEKDCAFAYPFPTDTKGLTIRYEALDGSTLSVEQRGGTINDASCLNKTSIYGIVSIRSEDDLRKALALARENKLHITPAGEHHSMGGQSFSRGGLVLDMHALNYVSVDQRTMTVTVGSGASWKEAQAVLDPMGLAIKAMQSINIFSIGGSLSVNAHGVAHNPGQIGPTVKSIRIMLASGEIVTATPTQNRELFSAVLGGYGLSGVIIDATLDIVPNEVYVWKTKYLNFKDFPAYYRANIVGNKDVALMYARLSISPDSYLTETAVHTYEYTDLEIPPQPLGSPKLVWVKRLVFNLSKTGPIGRWIRWNVEKNVEPGVHTCISRNNVMTGQNEEICVASRNQKMNQSMEYLDTTLKDTNILQEYFVPLDEATGFIDGLRTLVKEDKVNLLNVTLRVVTKDTITALPYAKGDRMAFVLYFNQKLNTEDSTKLEQATKDLITLAEKHHGTFYLPYQLYYTPEQLRAAYPEVDAFFALKRKYDPSGLFSNTWYETYKD
jgi:FAD/FMN-containing dehydrogenase